MVMHHATAIGRMMWRLAPRFEVWLHANGMNQAISLDMGEKLQKVSSHACCHAVHCAVSSAKLHQEQAPNPAGC